MNRWKIPPELEAEVLVRDTHCVYCGVEFVAADVPRRERASWEHVINDVNIVTRWNLGLCCIGCNASKGAKLLQDWLHSPYCERKGISAQTVAPVVRAVLNGDYQRVDRTCESNETRSPASRQPTDRG